ncbi:MAG: glycerol-3-phosphate dehydrogenase (NAD(P)+) [Alphaproteobacteria bacterium]|jgi:glycerol-3-phosphate dehydrogenase (NAD(P)+)
MTNQIGVIGAGAWGTALAQAIALSEKNVLLWAKETATTAEINKENTNNTYLEGVFLAETINATHNIEEVVKTCKTLFIACPSPYYTEIITSISQLITDEHEIVICSKGLRDSDGALMSDILCELIPTKPRIGVLAGPAFSKDISRGKPCMLTISSPSKELIKNVNGILSLPSLRLYHNEDMIGAQIGAALKNVVAIAAGIAREMDLGESVHAAIICRGIKEIERYSKALGGHKDTIYGLAGLGDIILTANSTTSRNYNFGRHLGQGLSTEEALAKSDGYIEGLNTARIVTVTALSQGVDLAIIAAVDGIVYGDISAEKVIKHLLERPRTHEWD